MFYPLVMQHLVTRRMDRVITVSESAAEETRCTFKVPREKIRVVYNGIDTEMFRELNGKRKERGRLLVVANTTDRKKGVIYLLRALQLLRGRLPVEEVVGCYARAEVAVVPSLYEGFCLPAAEAMACGLPVVATTAGALPEVVEDGKCGILVPPRDHHALAGALKRLLDDESLRQAMGEEGRERVKRHFTWEEAARKTLEVYQEVV